MKKLTCILVVSAYLTGCATYSSQVIPFRPPQDYGNYLKTEGIGVGAEAFVSPSEAEKVFGFDVRGAGLLPVQIVLDNQSGQGVEVVAGQTFLVDDAGRYWKMLTTREAVKRVDNATAGGAIASGAGKGAMIGAAAGTILGLALGIASGHRAGRAVITGAALGGASGALIGGASKADNAEQETAVAGDINSEQVEGKVFHTGSLANGFIFFPGEAASARELRIQIRFRVSGAVQTLMLPFRSGMSPQILPSHNVARPAADG